MAQHNDLGKEGEALACSYLKQHGYHILHVNWRFLKEEVDIIAEIGDELVFVEVKTRSGEYFENPADAVTNTKQRYLVNAADAYIKEYNIDKESRFDVIAIVKQGNDFDINHIEGAFYPGLST